MTKCFKIPIYIQDFIHHVLLPYIEGASKLLNKNYHKFPLIVAGDFNVNFAKDESLPLINFLKEVLNLDIINDRKTSATRCGTTIDAVFARFIDNLSTNLYVWHFSYHKPIVSIMKKNIPKEPIIPVMVEDMSIDESDVLFVNKVWFHSMICKCIYFNLFLSRILLFLMLCKKSRMLISL